MNLDPITFTLITAGINAAVTWGVITTKIAWIRRDVDELLRWKERMQSRGE